MQDGTVAWGDLTMRQDLPLPPALEEALNTRRKLFLRYVDEFGDKTERWVSPVHVHARKEYIYLRSWSLR